MKSLSYLEISAASLRHNLNSWRQLIGPKPGIIAVLKANAYGHGLAQVAPAIEELVSMFQVDDYEELLALRALTKKDIFLSGQIGEDELAAALALQPILALSDLAQARRLEATQAPVRSHLMIDAGFGRDGCQLSDLPELLAWLTTAQHLKVEAVCAHFATVSDPNDHYHERQLELFQQATKLAQEALGPIKTHCAATGATLKLPAIVKKSDYVRIGAGLYGIWPDESLRDLVDIAPALRWVSHVAQIKRIPAGQPIGYGGTFITSRETTLALIPQGYSDGLDRGLSNQGEALIGGTRCPIVGRISMNMCVADVTRLPNLKPGDEIVLLGTQGDEQITAEETAQKIDSINYEVIARLSALLPRILI